MGNGCCRSQAGNKSKDDDKRLQNITPPARAVSSIGSQRAPTPSSSTLQQDAGPQQPRSPSPKVATKSNSGPRVRLVSEAPRTTSQLSKPKSPSASPRQQGLASQEHLPSRDNQQSEIGSHKTGSAKSLQKDVQLSASAHQIAVVAVPPQQDPMPPQQDPMPPQQDPMPSQQDPMPPQQEDPMPPQQDPMPPQQDPMPSQQDPMPPQQDPMPPQQDPMPPQQDPMPPQQDPMPSQQDPMPPQQDPMPSQQDPMPPQQDPMPPQQDPMPPQQDPMPSQQDPMPPQQDPMPPQQDPMPPQQEDPMPSQQPPQRDMMDPTLDAVATQQDVTSVALQEVGKMEVNSHEASLPPTPPDSQ
ncbi:hypothetical protein EMCRGX_G019557 [Ephydatia muelleri]